MRTNWDIIGMVDRKKALSQVFLKFKKWDKFEKCLRYEWDMISFKFRNGWENVPISILYIEILERNSRDLSLILGIFPYYCNLIQIKKVNDTIRHKKAFGTWYVSLLTWILWNNKKSRFKKNIQQKKYTGKPIE